MLTVVSLPGTAGDIRQVRFIAVYFDAEEAEIWPSGRFPPAITSIVGAFSSIGPHNSATVTVGIDRCNHQGK